MLEKCNLQQHKLFNSVNKFILLGPRAAGGLVEFSRMVHSKFSHNPKMALQPARSAVVIKAGFPVLHGTSLQEAIF